MNIQALEYNYVGDKDGFEFNATQLFAGEWRRIHIYAQQFSELIVRTDPQATETIINSKLNIRAEHDPQLIAELVPELINFEYDNNMSFLGINFLNSYFPTKKHPRTGRKDTLNAELILPYSSSKRLTLDLTTVNGSNLIIRQLSPYVETVFMRIDGSESGAINHMIYTSNQTQYRIMGGNPTTDTYVHIVGSPENINIEGLNGGFEQKSH